MIGGHHWDGGIEHLHKNPTADAVCVFEIQEWKYIVRRDRSGSFIKETCCGGEVILQEEVLVLAA